MPNSSERRHFKRILFDADAGLRVGDTVDDVHLLDVSLKGALVQIRDEERQHPDVGEDVVLDIRLDETVHIEMRGRITHVEADHLGIESTGIDIESITHLRRLLELNLGDSGILDRELAALYHD
jgi:hypothetical protein